MNTKNLHQIFANYIDRFEEQIGRASCRERV